MSLTQVPSGMLQTTAQYYGFKNRVMNGQMQIDQRYSGAVQSPAPSGYSADRWALYKSGSGTWSYQLSSTAPAGFSSSMLLTVTATETPSSGDYFIIQQPIEGFTTSDFNWGTANAQTVTVSAWVYSSVTGTFSGAIRNSATTLSYAFSYSIPVANTWTQISATIPGPTTGTWVGGTNGVGLYLDFCLSAGSSNLTAAGSWTSGSYIGATGQTAWISTSGATFYVTGVQLEKGTQATSFDYRPITTELTLCQRYYWQIMVLGGTGGNYAGVAAGHYFASANAQLYLKYPVTMRSAPTFVGNTLLLASGSASTSVGSPNLTYTGTDSAMIQYNSLTASTVGYAAILYINNTTSGYLAASSEL